MTETALLTTAELVELTDRQTAPAQARRLRAMGVPHIYTPGAQVKVLRSALERRAGVEAPRRREGYAPEPDYLAFDR